MISGLKRSGKDYVALKIKELINKGSIISFAEPLKDIMAITLGYSKDELEDLKNNSNLEYRGYLQRFGTEAMKKHFGDDVWANLLLSKIKDDEVTIVSDWRFKSEYNVLAKHHDVITVRVHNDNLTPDSHISERDLIGFKFDHVLDNTYQNTTILDSLKPLIDEINS